MKSKKIVVFCGAHAKEKYKALAYETGKIIAQKGYILVSGGGLGMMEEVNRGSLEHGGETIGYRIKGQENPTNRYLSKQIDFPDFISRHKALCKVGELFIVLPGGIGTILEFLEITQLKKFKEIPKTHKLILVGNYFKPLISALDYYRKEGFVNESMSDLFIHVNRVEQLEQII